ncbi:MAG: flagellar basal body-associated protein FliL [Sulfuricurvum sp.]|jgi:flagellar FliL protein|uniref:flagellar basal body-associated protein FliL n=1 Tax=Sulfuricurvum sp. TaxID=2025608 RepID=UPI00260AC255|nr:flagellar basal body-associated protein FliL [Sulfuricurvum sp.]MDD2838581.1 flagellar basal body-associated protein FliL [Sulfuricurvum sp.]MDD3595915.1 flagellar basal body-associated protein FliL [Sulfuricurvum sp.]MDD4883218.1 flagellar basal body-associated protein FliL [Sulfuricurvum sp.]
MAEEKKEETGTEESGKKKSNVLLFVIIGVLLLILIIGGVVAFLLMGNEDAAAAKSAPAAKEASAGGSGESTPSDASMTEVGLMYPLDGFTVNLLSESGRRYLKVEMNLEIEGEELSAELDTKKPVLRDIIIRILSSKSLEEISTIKGKEKLKEQIVNELNMHLKDGKVKNIYFTDFVVQ